MLLLRYTVVHCIDGIAYLRTTNNFTPYWFSLLSASRLWQQHPGMLFSTLRKSPKPQIKKWQDPVIFFACAGEWGVMLVNMNAFREAKAMVHPPFA